MIIYAYFLIYISMIYFTVAPFYLLTLQYPFLKIINVHPPNLNLQMFTTNQFESN